MSFKLENCFANEYVLNRCYQSLHNNYGIGDPNFTPVKNTLSTSCECKTCPRCIYEGELSDPIDFQIQFFILDRLQIPYKILGGINYRLETVIFINPIPFTIK